MPVALAAALAALLTPLSFVAPELLGLPLALALAAAACRLTTLMLLRRAYPAQQRGLRILLFGEALFAAATVAGLPVEPHGAGSGAVGWAGLALWLACGAAGAWGGLGLLAAGGWLRGGGILVAAAAGLWLTAIGLILWPFALAAGYGCFAVAGLKKQKISAD